MFDEAATEVEKQLMKTSPGGLTYFVEQKYGRVEHKMDHLACFTGKKCYAPGRSS
jgi:mannosyl-oligosaccharide alpha-1,2-mannosidase